MWTSTVVSDHERGFLVRQGRFAGILAAGRHSWFDPFGKLRVIKCDISQPETDSPWVDIIRRTNYALFDRHFEHVSTADNKIAIVRVEDHIHTVVPPGTSQTFWKDLVRIKVEYVDISNAPAIDPAMLTGLQVRAPEGLIQTRLIKAHETGLMFVNGRYKRLLSPGRHGFWSDKGAVEIHVVDMREREVAVTTQSMLTHDHITLSMTLSATWKVVDPQKASFNINDLDGRITRSMLSAIQGAVAARSLEDVLGGREAMDAELNAVVRAMARESELGIQIDSVQINEILLPDNMREILYRVVEAEKHEQADIIRRREEAAALEALASTARQMENNPTLMRLRELEALEKLLAKIGQVDLPSTESAGINNMLSKILLQRTHGKDGDG